MKHKIQNTEFGTVEFKIAQDLANDLQISTSDVINMDVKISEEHQEYTWETYTKAESLLFWKQQKIGLKTFLDMLNEGGKKLLLSEITV